MPFYDGIVRRRRMVFPVKPTAVPGLVSAVGHSPPTGRRWHLRPRLLVGRVVPAPFLLP
jgi:hypothetical protein